MPLPQTWVRRPENVRGWLGPYSNDEELKDPWDHPYAYSLHGNGFELVGYGSDRRPGGEGHAKDVVLTRH